MLRLTDTKDFWKKRIDEAINYCKDIRFSVYWVRKDEWSRINDVHAGLFKKLIPRTVKVLDAGCGYGRWAKFFPKTRYTGVDFSPEFLEIARKENPEHNFVEADLAKLPFKDGEFSWAFCISIKEMVSARNPEAWPPMLQELKRVAKKVLILEYTNPNLYEIL